MATVLIVYAHHTKTSFNAAMLEVGKTTLEEQGHRVIVSDLYAMNFNPVLSRNDFTMELDKDKHFNYQEVMCKAYAKGQLSEDILAEQRKLEQADLVIFQFPLQMMMIPAILKGWCEKVTLFTNNISKWHILDKAYMKGKKALLSVTTAGSRSFLSPAGPMGDINVLMWPFQGALQFKGFEVLKHNVCYAVPSESQEYRLQCLSKWAKRLENIFDEEVLYCPKLDDFVACDANNPFKGALLSKDYRREGDEDGEYGASIGQHMGRKVCYGDL